MEESFASMRCPEIGYYLKNVGAATKSVVVNEYDETTRLYIMSDRRDMNYIQAENGFPRQKLSIFIW